MTWQRDDLKIELLGYSNQGALRSRTAAVFDQFTSFELVNDITTPSEASFEVGDDGTWDEIEDFIALGAEYRVTLNGSPRLTGRVELTDVPIDASGGSVVRFTIRTKLMDAMYASGDLKSFSKDISLEDFILRLYAPLGYTKDDFEVQSNLARNLLTGEDMEGSGEDKADLEKITLDEAKVNPPESIYAAADRHLRRFGYMHWDSPDGKIVIGAPNDAQKPRYSLFMCRGEKSEFNNALEVTRSKDWSGIPSAIRLYGKNRKRGTARTPVRAIVTDEDVDGAGFHRPVTIIADAVKTNEMATRAARREMSARSKLKDCLEFQVDGLGWWNGNRSVPWAVDSTCNVQIDTAGGAIGSYYIHRTTCRRDAAGGDISVLTMLKKGVWVL